MSHPINRRSFLQTTGAAAGLAASGTMMSVLPARADGHAYTIRMQLGWLASNGIMGEVMADHLGYFEEEGLALEIIPGGPNIDGVPSVASGVNNFGSISSSPSLMLARSAGLPVKCIAAGYQRHPFTYFSLAGNPVRTPQDLIGKTVATQGTARILLRALLAHNGIAEDDVEVSVMGADMNALMTGQVDVVTGWTTNVNALSILGDQRVDLALWDGGIQLYANPYYTTDAMLAEHGDKMQAAIRAISRGWGAAHDDPEAAVEALVARYPNLDRDSEMLAAPLVLDFSFNAQTAAGGWGVMTEENWQAQIDIYDQLDQFANGAPALDDVMTLEILEATADTRPTHG
ncbi:ABC transporter substrate-binding protein [Rhodophyticola porphyridii]|uniref:Thiamine pyrimidine synthase n=1 Tax=Rhodophyticola porphyridii TaxID=1852017 RepID=A0A3L9Y7F1_9RHOB|nr:ABC transporter substrate-binding protein [Rhodophyticola porphyridii]RMA42243.1 ABC transporter substrate-binding protein [Rhodophyticola porphyridii]